MHRLILAAKKGEICDHIDGDGLNNQKFNLRFVSNRQNQQNQKNKTSSTYPGVYWRKSDRRWVARIKINNESKYLGQFKSEKDAFKAYKEAVSRLTGEKLVNELESVLA
jgi:hypothetical protein